MILLESKILLIIAPPSQLSTPSAGTMGMSGEISIATGSSKYGQSGNLNLKTGSGAKASEITLEAGKSIADAMPGGGIVLSE